MHQVTEILAAEGVVAEILDDGPSIGIGMCLPDLVFRKSRISLEQEGLDLISPEQVYDFLVRQNGVRGRGSTAHQQDDHNCQCATVQEILTVSHGTSR